MANPRFAFTLTVVKADGTPTDIIATPAFTDKSVTAGATFEIPFTLTHPTGGTVPPAMDANWVEPATVLIADIGLNDAKNAVVLATPSDEGGSVTGVIEIVVA